MKGDARLIQEENGRIRCLRRLIDETLDRLRSENLEWEDGRDLIRRTRAEALVLFPGKEAEFDRICKPRFYRVLDEKMRLM